MTTDTRLSDFLTDPANAVPRVYTVSVNGLMTPQDVGRLCEGILDRGEMLKAEAVTLRKSSRRESHLVVRLSEGKNREIRRMFEALGCEVTALKRVSLGTLSLGDLKPAQFREVALKEILQKGEKNIKMSH